jgi:hypothetical protein
LTAGESSIQRGEVISYTDMCRHEGASLQRGMNFRLGGQTTVILMSVRPGAPYVDRIEERGQVLVYEGHDAAKTAACPLPKRVDQPEFTPVGRPTQNGLFWNAAMAYKNRGAPAELVRVYEKLRTGIWVYSGLFELVDAWKTEERGRKVFKFRLRLSKRESCPSNEASEIEHDRLIPTHVKIEVWKRDKGKCVLCGSKENLHFDHIAPFSKGGTSLLAENIQLLCARHNLSKHDRIE